MTWARLDDRYPQNLKVSDLSDAAFRLHISAICYAAAQLTDGFVPDSQLPRLMLGRWQRAYAELLTAGLFEPVDNGVMVHDYLDYNPSRAKVEADRTASVARQERYRQRKAARTSTERNAVTNAVGHAVTNSAPSHPVIYVTDTHPSIGETEANARADASAREGTPPPPLPPSDAVHATADVLAATPWIRAAPDALLHGVARSFELVGDFDARAGPLEAEQFGHYHAPKPPKDWYLAWLKWLKKAVTFAREPRGRPREPDFSGINAFDDELKRLGFS